MVSIGQTIGRSEGHSLKFLRVVSSKELADRNEGSDSELEQVGIAHCSSQTKMRVDTANEDCP